LASLVDKKAISRPQATRPDHTVPDTYDQYTTSLIDSVKQTCCCVPNRQHSTATASNCRQRALPAAGRCLFIHSRKAVHAQRKQSRAPQTSQVASLPCKQAAQEHACLLAVPMALPAQIAPMALPSLHALYGTSALKGGLQGCKPLAAASWQFSAPRNRPLATAEPTDRRKTAPCNSSVTR
jgi:hypothetical protein